MDNEPLLTENKKRFVLVVKHPDIDKFYQTHVSTFWTPSEIDFSQDIRDWKKMTEDEQKFIKYVLAFFAGSDGIVNENLVENFSREIQVPEVRAFFSIQMAMETIHSETYRLSLETLIQDSDEQIKLFDAIEQISSIKKKAEWALKWTNPETASFAERLVAFIVVEGLFFSGSFCAIFWLKSKGLLPGVCFSNELISRDEGLHCEFGLHLYNNYIVNRLPEEKIKEIVSSAFETEKEFIVEALPVGLVGMNQKSMIQYIQYVADRLLLQMGCTKEYHAENPFHFMEMISLEGKTNFFERRVSEYKKPTKESSDGLVFDENF